jgi:hypothetical protein
MGTYYKNLRRPLTQSEQERVYAISPRVRIADDPPRLWLEQASGDDWAALQAAVAKIEQSGPAARLPRSSGRLADGFSFTAADGTVIDYPGDDDVAL